MKKRFFNNNGYTLVELVAVLVILSIIFLFAKPNYQRYTLQKDIFAMKTDVELIETLLKDYLIQGTVSEEEEKTNMLKDNVIYRGEAFVQKDNLDGFIYNDSQKNKIMNIVSSQGETFKGINVATLENDLGFNDSLTTHRTNNNISDYYVVYDNNMFKVFHKTGYLLNDIYHNGFDTWQ